MAILSVIPVLNCQSVDVMLNFYQHLMQFVVVKKRELHGQLQWVHIMHGNITLMLQVTEQKHFQTSLSQQSNITLYFFVDDINELHHLIKLKYKAVSEIELTDYHIREFKLSDPEGNSITVGQKS